MKAWLKTKIEKNDKGEIIRGDIGPISFFKCKDANGIYWRENTVSSLFPEDFFDICDKLKEIFNGKYKD